MSTDSMGYTLALLVIGMTFVAVRYRNMLLTLGAAILWATMLAFILANTTAGTNWQTMFILGTVAFMSALAFISFVSRKRGETSFTENIGGIESREDRESNRPLPRRRGLMDLETGEYQRYLRTRIKRRRR